MGEPIKRLRGSAPGPKSLMQGGRGCTQGMECNSGESAPNQSAAGVTTAAAPATLRLLSADGFQKENLLPWGGPWDELGQAAAIGLTRCM